MTAFKINMNICRKWHHYHLPHCRHQHWRYHYHPFQQYRSTTIASVAATIIASQHVSGHILTLYNLACNNIVADTLPISYLRARLLDRRELGGGRYVPQIRACKSFCRSVAYQFMVSMFLEFCFHGPVPWLSFQIRYPPFVYKARGTPPAEVEPGPKLLISEIRRWILNISVVFKGKNFS